MYIPGCKVTGRLGHIGVTPYTFLTMSSLYTGRVNFQVKGYLVYFFIFIIMFYKNPNSTDPIQMLRSAMSD